MTLFSGYQPSDRKLRIEGLNGEPDVLIQCIIEQTPIDLIFTRVWGADNAPVSIHWHLRETEELFFCKTEDGNKEKDDLIVGLAAWADGKLDDLWRDYHRARDNDEWEPPPRKWKYVNKKLVHVDEIPESMFDDQSDPIDWAEEEARSIVIQTFELANSFSFNPKFPQNIAISLSISLASQLREFKATLYQKNEGEKDSRFRKMRQEFLSPTSLAELCQQHAGKLDRRGWTAEAGVLREAAAILEEDC